MFSLVKFKDCPKLEHRHPNPLKKKKLVSLFDKILACVTNYRAAMEPGLTGRNKCTKCVIAEDLSQAYLHPMLASANAPESFLAKSNSWLPQAQVVSMPFQTQNWPHQIEQS